MDAFDADVLIYAAVPGHPLGRRVRALFADPGGPDQIPRQVGTGSVLLIPELLTKPLAEDVKEEVAVLSAFLARLDLLPADRKTALMASVLGATYGLRAADAVHLATAVAAGATRFLTNNSRDFRKSITELEIIYAAELPDPTVER